MTRTAGAIDPTSRTLLTEVQVPNPDGLLLSGSYATVRFKVERRAARRSLVPQSALLIDANGVRVARRRRATARSTTEPIQIGRDYGERSRGALGLEPTDVLATGLAANIMDGSRVEVAKPAEPEAEPGEARMRRHRAHRRARPAVARRLHGRAELPPAGRRHAAVLGRARADGAAGGTRSDAVADGIADRMVDDLRRPAADVADRAHRPVEPHAAAGRGAGARGPRAPAHRGGGPLAAGRRVGIVHARSAPARTASSVGASGQGVQPLPGGLRRQLGARRLRRHPPRGGSRRRERRGRGGRSERGARLPAGRGRASSTSRYRSLQQRIALANQNLAAQQGTLDLTRRLFDAGPRAGDRRPARRRPGCDHRRDDPAARAAGCAGDARASAS